MSTFSDNPQQDGSLQVNPQPVNKKNISPCIRNCCLDEGDICLGCFRSLAEIIGWQEKSSTEQRTILVNCAQRKNEQSDKRKR